MTDARFPERWLNDRRLLRLPDDAFRLFTISLVWSVANQSDGRLYDDDLALIPGIPRSVLAAYSDGNGLPVVPGDVPAIVLHLVKAGLWERVADYWVITVFADTQTTRSDLEILANGRRAQREKKRRQRAAKSRKDGGSLSQSGIVPGDKRGDTPRSGQARTRTGQAPTRSEARVNVPGALPRTPPGRRRPPWTPGSLIAGSGLDHRQDRPVIRRREDQKTQNPGAPSARSCVWAGPEYKPRRCAGPDSDRST